MFLDNPLLQVEMNEAKNGFESQLVQGQNTFRTLPAPTHPRSTSICAVYPNPKEYIPEYILIPTISQQVKKRQSNSTLFPLSIYKKFLLYFLRLNRPGAASTETLSKILVQTSDVYDALTSLNQHKAMGADGFGLSSYNIFFSSL